MNWRGIEKSSKLVRGIPDPLMVEEYLANLIFDYISPPLVPEIEILPWKNTYVVAVRIYPSSARSHILMFHGVFVRVGCLNRLAHPSLRMNANYKPEMNLLMNSPW